MKEIIKKLEESHSRFTTALPIRTDLDHEEYSDRLLSLRNILNKQFPQTPVIDGVAQDDEFIISNFDRLLVLPGSSTQVNIPLWASEIKPLNDNILKAANLFKKLWIKFKNTKFDRNKGVKINRKSRSGWVNINEKVLNKLPDQFRAKVIETNSPDLPHRYILTDIHGIPEKLKLLETLSQATRANFQTILTQGYRKDNADEVEKGTSKTRTYVVLNNDGKFVNVDIDPYIKRLKRIAMRTRTVFATSVYEHAEESGLSQNVNDFFKTMRCWMHHMIPKVLSQSTYTIHYDVNRFDGARDIIVRDIFLSIFVEDRSYKERLENTPIIVNSYKDSATDSTDVRMNAKIIKAKDTETGTLSGTSLTTSNFNYFKFGLMILAALFQMNFTEAQIEEWLFVKSDVILFDHFNIGDDNSTMANGRGVEQAKVFSMILQEVSIYKLDLKGHTIAGQIVSVNRVTNIDLPKSMAHAALNPRRWNSILKPFQNWGWQIKKSIHPNYAKMIDIFSSHMDEKFRNWLAVAEEPENLVSIGLDFKSDLNALYWREDIPKELVNIVYYTDIKMSDINSLI